MKTPILIVGAAAAILLAGAACAESKAPAKAEKPAATAKAHKAEAKSTKTAKDSKEGSKTAAAEAAPSKAAFQLFRNNCSTCHGVLGNGHSAMANFLRPRPSNFTDPKWQASLTDAQIVDVITHGGDAKTVKVSSKMPHFGSTFKKGQIEELKQVVRSFGPKSEKKAEKKADKSEKKK